MKHDQRLKAAILRVASKSPEFRKALLGELKTARTEFSDVARQVGQKLKARAIPVPFNRVQELKNYRDPRLELDTEAPPVAYLIKDIEYVERTMMSDSEGAPGDLEVIIDAILVPCVVKSNKRKAMLVLTYDGQSNPLSSQAYDEDYDIEPFKVSDVVKMIEGTASGVAWADEEANIRAASSKTADVEAVRNTAFNVARKLQGQVKELPIDKIPTLRNYRDAKLVLDPAAESAYLVKGIDVAWEFDSQDYHLNISDPQDHVNEDVEGTFSVLFIPCLTKAGGHPAMEFELSEEGKLPWQDLHDRDYRIRRWQDKEIVDWIKQSFEGILESDFWEKNDEEDYRYASAPVSILTPPKFDANQYRYFKGPGKTLMRTWRERKENPKWNLINRVVEHFQGYKYLREKPGWEDQEQTVSIMDAMDKLTKYRDHLYPGGKPKKVRKKTPRMMFLEMMVEPEIKSLISKFSRIFKGKPAEAAQFAYDVLEDANFHRDGRNMNVAMADYSGTTRIAPSAVAQKLGWDSTVLPFAVGIVSGAGDKRGAAQMLKAFVQNNKEWLTPAD